MRVTQTQRQKKDQKLYLNFVQDQPPEDNSPDKPFSGPPSLLQAQFCLITWSEYPCDALATALMVSGDDGAQFFGRAELSEYSAWVIDRHDGGAWAVGPIFVGDNTLK